MASPSFNNKQYGSVFLTVAVYCEERVHLCGFFLTECVTVQSSGLATLQCNKI